MPSDALLPPSSSSLLQLLPSPYPLSPPPRPNISTCNHHCCDSSSARRRGKKCQLAASLLRAASPLTALPSSPSELSPSALGVGWRAPVSLPPRLPTCNPRRKTCGARDVATNPSLSFKAITSGALPLHFHFATVPFRHIQILSCLCILIAAWGPFPQATQHV